MYLVKLVYVIKLDTWNTESKRSLQNLLNLNIF